MSDRRIETLDGLRGLAILGVVAVHVAGGVPGFSGPLANLANFGSRGVILFFVVSAIALSAAHEASLTLPSFFARRFFRIAPMFYLAIPVYLVVDGTSQVRFFPDGIGPKQVLLSVSFLHVWWIDSFSSVVPGGWSIGCEMSFYVAFALLFATCTTWRRAGLWLAAAFLFAGVWRLLVKAMFLHEYGTFQTTSFLAFSVPTNLPAFVGGILIFRIVRDSELVGSVAGRRFAWATMVGSAALLVVSGATGSLVLRQPLVVTPMILGFVAGAVVVGGRFFTNRPVTYLGVVSFSVYIVHFAILDLLRTHVLPMTEGLPPSQRFGLLFVETLALSVLLATATFRLIEQPGVRLGRWAAAAVAPRRA